LDPGNRKAVMAALIANAGIAVAKFVGYVFTGASSMLAEGVHSVADSGNQALLLWGGAAAEREPTDQHPFGHGRERYFWAFVVSLVIFALGSVFAIYEGVHKLGSTDPIVSPHVAVIILSVGIVLEGWSFRTAVKEAQKQKRNLSWSTFLRKTKNPELPVVLLEDLGALIGLVLALVGVSLAWVTGDPVFDALGSIVIGILLGLISFVLAWEMKSLLIGEAATVDHRRLLEESAASAPFVRRVIHMRTQHIGPEQLLVGAKVEFDGALAFEALTEAIDGVESAMRGSVPHEVIVYVEPDVYDAAHPDLGSNDGGAGH